MSVTIRLPTVLRRLADDEKEVAVEAATVGGCLQELGKRHPALAQQLLDDAGGIRPFVRVFVDQIDAEDLQGAETPVAAGATLRIVPAIAGGSAAMGFTSSLRSAA